MKTEDFLIVGLVGMAAWLMLKSQGQTAPLRTVTMPTGGATIGNYVPQSSLADYMPRYKTTSTAATGWDVWEQASVQSTNWWQGMASGMIPDANSAGVLPGAMEYGMSVDPNSIAGIAAGW